MPSGKLPRGVSWDRSHRGKKKYKTRVFWNGRDRFIGRFETAEEASRAYTAAAALFHASPEEEAEKPEFLQLVRELIQQQESAAGIGNEQAAEWPQGAGLLLPVDDTRSCQPGSCQPPQNSFSGLQQCTSQDSADDVSALCLPGGDGAVTNAADAADATPGGAAADMEVDASPAVLAASCRGSMDLEEAVSDMIMEELMTQEVFRAIGLLPEQQQQPTLRQAGTAGTLKWSSSCTNLGAALMLQQQEPIQRPQSCTPSSTGAAATSSGLLRPASGSGSLSSAFSCLPGQQAQQGQEDLQQLLHTALLGAGQQAEESPSAPAELQLQDQAVQQCCTEFLAATAVPATPAMSAPACCLQPQHTLAQQQQCASAGDMAGAGIETAGSTELPQGLARQDSLLLRQASCSSCVDAMQYIAAVVRAVLKLYTTLVHRPAEEDAAADLLLWLSSFRQQQITDPAASLEAVSGFVIQLMARIVQTLVTSSGAAAAPAAAQAVASSRGSFEVTSANSASGSAAPLARRSFVVGVLERLNANLVGLHSTLQQQHRQQGAAAPGALWQEVQGWMEQLHAQAATPEDRMAAQLAALL